MGAALKKLFGNKEMRILMLGLDSAGKTSAFSSRFPAATAGFSTAGAFLGCPSPRGPDPAALRRQWPPSAARERVSPWRAFAAYCTVD